ncbi:hypothetical protein Leryth_022477 [Lithospermum erythrorhizon]|nr:hypothetical protein Leryth_022477 [Lithospermum erythrorhizon]
MNCCRPRRYNTPPSSPETSIHHKPSIEQMPSRKKLKHEILLSIPWCKVHLMDEGEAVEIANGDFSLFRITEDNVSVATIIKVGDHLQWPLTKDEPVVKLDAIQYLFSLKLGGNTPLSYGVTFSRQSEGKLGMLDSFLKENSLFTCSKLSNTKKEIDWNEFAPKVEDYNNVLAKAIAGGTGQIVKGIFRLSNAYSNQVHQGGETIMSQQDKKSVSPIAVSNNHQSEMKKSSVNESLKRARKLSETTEKMSKALLDGVGIVSGSAMGPILKSEAGKTFFTMVPGEVLLASLDAVNRVLDAAEAAQKQSLTATTGAVTGIVSKRYGENAGEATGDALATAGHVAGTAWNVVKIRKAINPASSVSAGILKNAAKDVK